MAKTNLPQAVMHPEAAAVHPVGATRFARLSTGSVVEVRIVRYVGAAAHPEGFDEFFEVAPVPEERWPFEPMQWQESRDLHETPLRANLALAERELLRRQEDAQDTRARLQRLERAVVHLERQVGNLKAEVLAEDEARAKDQTP